MIFANKHKIQIYDSDNIDQLIWPKTEEGLFAKKILVPLIKDGISNYFNNVKTMMNVILIDDVVLPITINDNEIGNSYVCSFHSYYIGCALNNLDAIKNKFLRRCVEAIVKCLGKFLKAGNIDKVVSVNNWLFSTNLYPKLGNSEILCIREFIKKKYPDHAIVFRSINGIDKNLTSKTLKNNHFDMVASRQVFITNTKETQIFETRLFKSDIRFLNKSEYEIGDSPLNSDDEISKILSLYNALYVDKYSNISPQLNEKFVKLLVDQKLFKFKTLKKNDQIDGILGYYSAYGVLTSPFFGYDMNQPSSSGLYRTLSTLLTLEAKNSGELFHQSSGASFYKTLRRATPDIEYSAVYTRHLSLNRRFYWKTLKIIMNDFGVYWMKKY